jgi:hypothetical protein
MHLLIDVLIVWKMCQAWLLETECKTQNITDPQLLFFTWLGYLASAYYPNIGDVRYEAD